VLGDETWHGSTSSAAALAAWTGADPADAQRFLAQARRQRQEQRKLARLVLEGSTRAGGAFGSVSVGGGGGGGGGGGSGSGAAAPAAPAAGGGVAGLWHKLRGGEQAGGGPTGARRGWGARRCCCSTAATPRLAR
jgi:hypothetical protein